MTTATETTAEKLLAQKTLSSNELLNLIRAKERLRIKVYNLGENLGMDFAFFGHYRAIRKLFPYVQVNLYRSNVDETNCIGLENFFGKAFLSLDGLKTAVVKQRDANERDWVSYLNAGDLSIFTPEFLDNSEADIVCCIGMASSPAFQKHIDKPIISISTIQHAVEQHLREIGWKDHSTPIQIGCRETEVREWDRTALEYLSLSDPYYPFRWDAFFERSALATDYKDYLRIGLRWPDHVRWYYNIERQFELLFDIISRIRIEGKPVKIVFTLKDGEVGNNFNRGQTHALLNKLQSLCDDILFTYSWTIGPYHHRLSEKQELNKLREYGIYNVKKLDIWEDILLATHCKVYFSDPGGFAEVAAMTRKDADTTFIMPVSFNHASTYLILNSNRKVIRTKINPICTEHFYECIPTLNDEKEIPRRVICWEVKYQDKTYKIGEDCRGDDWWHFEQAQATVFKELYEKTAPALIKAIVSEYCK